MCDVAIPTRSETPFIVRHEIATSALLPPRDDRHADGMRFPKSCIP